MEIRRVGVHVSTSKMELVVTYLMSPYLARADNAFASSFLDGQTFQSDREKACMMVIMKNHGKTVARMVSVSKIIGRNDPDQFRYEQRISLPHPCKHIFASQFDGDNFFYGKKLIQKPDGSVHLHVELLCETADGYNPEEVRSIPTTHIASPASFPPSAAAQPSSTLGGQACFTPPSNVAFQKSPCPMVSILENEYDGVAARPRSAKRLCTFQDSEQKQSATMDDDAESIFDEFTVYSGEQTNKE